MVFPAEVLPLDPNSFYRLRVDENLASNEVWPKLKRTATLETTLRTEDDHCKVVKVASGMGKEIEVLCKYVETRCFCQQIFICTVCSKNRLHGKKGKEGEEQKGAEGACQGQSHWGRNEAWEEAIRCEDRKM